MPNCWRASQLSDGAYQTPHLNLKSYLINQSVLKTIVDDSVVFQSMGIILPYSNPTHNLTTKYNINICLDLYICSVILEPLATITTVTLYNLTISLFTF